MKDRARRGYLLIDVAKYQIAETASYVLARTWSEHGIAESTSYAKPGGATQETSFEPARPATPDRPDDPPLSPYAEERQHIRELTMPIIPDFSIPPSPPLPPADSEEAEKLAATTKKFDRFLELKKQGVHFNDRLKSSAALRNPSLLPKLLEFAGISEEEACASPLPEDAGGVPLKWHEAWYAENLMKACEKSEKKKRAERDGIDFVPAASGGLKQDEQSR